MFLSRLRRQHASQKPRGFSVVESLLALPVLLFVAFAIIQIGLLWHARFALTHAALVAARHASTHHADDRAIRDGLVQGLMPFVSKANSLSEMPAALFRSGAELAIGLAAGWIRWEVLSPTEKSFSDWGAPADSFFSANAAIGEIEIPATQMASAILHKTPSSGVSGYSDGYPIGQYSGQTLIDANVLKLRLQVGVPLNMPFAGTLMAKALGYFSGCGLLNAADSERRTPVGAIDFGRSAKGSMFSPQIECRALAARDADGNWRPRWPISVTTSVLMQSNPRKSVMKLAD